MPSLSISVRQTATNARGELLKIELGDRNRRNFVVSLEVDIKIVNREREGDMHVLER